MNTSENKDIYSVNPTTFQKRNLEIADHAIVDLYEVDSSLHIDIQADANEICLFCTKSGQVNLFASFIPHPLELMSNEAIFLAFPKGSWNVRILANEGTSFYTMKMEVGVLHQLINPSFDQNRLHEGRNVNMRDLMRVIGVSPSMLMCFDQLMQHRLSGPFGKIFEKAKFLEIFSLLMETSFGQAGNTCPVALSPAIERKLHHVRRHIIQHLDEIPDPDKLSVMYELPRNTLREGYRYVYGKTIHQYHADHKLESAMQMLIEGEMLVKEVAFKIGYQNPSHFISAFKKKFGCTPKQYLRRDTVSL